MSLAGEAEVRTGVSVSEHAHAKVRSHENGTGIQTRVICNHSYLYLDMNLWSIAEDRVWWCVGKANDDPSEAMD